MTTGPTARGSPLSQRASGGAEPGAQRLRSDCSLQQLVNGLSLGGIYALIALGYTMVYGIIELINFAHGDIYTLGTFFSLAVLTLLGVTGRTARLAVDRTAILTIFVAMLLCGITGVLVERLAYRRLRNAPRLAPLITAIGMSFILENIMQYWRGPSPVPFPEVFPNPIFHVGSVDIAFKADLRGLAGGRHDGRSATVHLQHETRQGDARTAQDRDAAQLMGVDINTMITLTFLIGRALAGAAGFVSGVYYGTTWFFNGFSAGLKAFTAAVLGGIGNFAGAMLGGFLIGSSRRSRRSSSPTSGVTSSCSRCWCSC